MLIDQAEIDALLSQADELVQEAGGDPGASAPSPPSPPRSQKPQPSSLLEHASPEVARILRIRVPVIVRLACRQMSISVVRKLSCGGIIEFEKHVDDPLDLLINNRRIGRGEAVKVGENFGLRLTAVEAPTQRIKSLGR